jgi:hypothetical protein
MDPPFAENRAAICADDESGVGRVPRTQASVIPAVATSTIPTPTSVSPLKPDWNAYVIWAFAAGVSILLKALPVATSANMSGPVSLLSALANALKPIGNGSVIGSTRLMVAVPLSISRARYRLYDAVMNDDYSAMRQDNSGRVLAGGLIGFWPGMSVTFVDNHDTEWCREAEHQANYDNTRHFPGSTVEMAYAYTLTHPGVPCVFWQHFFDWGHQTRGMIERLMHLRRQRGIISTSRLEISSRQTGVVRGGGRWERCGQAGPRFPGRRVWAGDKN